MKGSTTRRIAAVLIAPVTILATLAILANAALVVPAMPPELMRVAGALNLGLSAVLIALIVHDLAHWLAARVAGFRAVEATVGPFVFAPSRRGMHLRTVATWRALRGGVLVEPQGERRMNARWALVALAGPAASLALGIATISIAPVIAAASLLRFALSAIPSGVRGEPSDGAQLLLLAGGGAAADRFVALLRIAGAQRAGQRPRSWPDRWTADAIAMHDGTAAEAAGCVAAFRRALDGCAHEKAAVLLDRALALRAALPGRAACALLADAAYFEARIHDDAARAQVWLDEAATRRPACPVAMGRASAAVLLASGDFAGGVAAARAALEDLDRVERVERRTQPMESDWLREMLARAECAAVLPAEFLAAS
jgi:hypothetical protein